MSDILGKLSDQEIMEFIKNIDSKKLCFLMMGLSTGDKDHIYSQMSDKAQEMINADIAKLEAVTGTVDLMV